MTDEETAPPADERKPPENNPVEFRRFERLIRQIIPRRGKPKKPVRTRRKMGS